MARSSQPGKWESTSVPGIYKRNGQYVVRVWNPDKGQHGGRDDYPATSFDEAKSIKRAKDEARARRSRVGGQRYTLKEWGAEPEGLGHLPREHEDRMPEWLRLIPRPKMSTNLYNIERTRAFVAKYGDRDLPGVSVLEAQKWAREHPSTVNVIRAMLNDAKRLRVIDENPFEHIKVARGRGRKDIKTLSVDELTELLALTARIHGEFGERVYSPVLGLRAWTGLRPGEVYALSADHIDMKTMEVHVEWQWHSKLRKLEKLKNGLERTVVLLDQAAEQLERMKLPKKGPILTTVEGSRFSARTEHYYWDPVRTAFAASLDADHWLPMRIAEKGKIGSLDVYELRHFFGTELAHNGCSQYEIAAQMGHLDGGKIANETYIHIDQERARESVRQKLRKRAA